MNTPTIYKPVSSSRRPLRLLALGACVLMGLIPMGGQALNLSQKPLFLTQSESPLVMLTMARDHKLYYEAYNDYSDLDGDGSLDVGYKPGKIDYYGYFDSYKCYTYDASGFFTPDGARTPAVLSDSMTDAQKQTERLAKKKCTGKWSGDFLNYVTTSRMDAMRKVLYGGYRVTDTTGSTILERAFIPQDAHSWGKEYASIARDGYDIRDFTPLDLPSDGRYHILANVTLTSSSTPPSLRVLTNTTYRVWEWLSIERPVAGAQCATGNNSRANCAGAAPSWAVVPSGSFTNLRIRSYDTASITRLFNTTNGSKTLSGGDTTGIQVGDIVYGNGISGPSYVTAIVNGTDLTINNNANATNAAGTPVIFNKVATTTTNFTRTNGNKNLTGGNTTGISTGNRIYGTGIANNATVNSISSGTALVMNSNATSSGTNSVTFTTSTSVSSGISSPGDGADFEKIFYDAALPTATTNQANQATWRSTNNVSTIDCDSSASQNCNYSAGTTNYLSIIYGQINFPAAGTYDLAIDGDDAVELIIGPSATTVTGAQTALNITWNDGKGATSQSMLPSATYKGFQSIDGTRLLTLGYYDEHGFVGNQTKNGSITITTPGQYNLVFRHHNHGGAGGYRLWSRLSPSSAPIMTDYTARVEVCKSGKEEPNCKAYGNGSTVQKPIGLLQSYGDNNGMFFGLLTGSYKNNTQGGVLRRTVSSINDEIDSDNGIFHHRKSVIPATVSPTIVSSPFTYTNGVVTNGIIATIDKLAITSFNYSNQSYSCGWITTRQMKNGECEMWGNPLGEMIYETLRYFAGKNEATVTQPLPKVGFADPVDTTLGLPTASWNDPYATFPSCSKPYILAISDVYPSFDSDTIPGSPFSTFAGDISGLNMATLGQTMWNHEFGNGVTKQIFMGQTTTTNFDSAPTVKSATTFGTLRGLAPSEPTREGSFSAAIAAYYGHITNLRSPSGVQKVSTYAVALSSPLPTIEVPIPAFGTTAAKKVTIIPFAKSVGGSSISATQGQFQPTNQIVDFYVEKLVNVTALNEDIAINGGLPYYRFRINYEDVEQGADHDMDAIVTYTISLVDTGSDATPDGRYRVKVETSSDYAAGGIIQHMGYVISGTTRDGVYLTVRDSDTSAGSDPVYFLNTVCTDTDAVDCPNAGALTTGTDNLVVGQNALPLSWQAEYIPSTTASSATLLKDPLWYMAKYGGFTDDNGNGLPDTTEWDSDGDGVPDNYFLVVNPLKLEEQLSRALAKIKVDSGSASALATNSSSFQADLNLYQARFNSGDWTGEIYAYPIITSGSNTGDLGEATWEAHRKMTYTSNAGRVVLTYDKDATTKGIPFLYDSMTAGGTLRGSLDRLADGTIDNNGSTRVSYLRGTDVTASWLRPRPCIRGTSGAGCIPNLLGDLVDSAIQYVGKPNFGYAGDDYKGFRDDNWNRTHMIYVGANDGMLHGFDATTGVEKIAYVPSEMYRQRGSQYLLSKLTQPDYGKTANPHHYYVDGTPTVGDICVGASCSSGTSTKDDWKTILVGGLNGGGQGIYALDITKPSEFSETNASSKVLWEFNDWQDADADSTMMYGLGYTYSRPAIAKICMERKTKASGQLVAGCQSAKWAVIFGNGYNNSEADGYASSSGHAILYVLDAATGSVIRKISTKVGSSGAPNGLATVSAVDLDGDRVVDYVYGGDLFGNMWKFDLAVPSTVDGTTLPPSSWRVAFWDNTAAPAGPKPLPLYAATDSTGAVQPITTAPEVMAHPNGGAMILFGTGKYLEDADKNTTQVQTFYGIWDKPTSTDAAPGDDWESWGAPKPVPSNTTRSNLQQQSVYTTSATNFTLDADANTTTTVRTSTSNSVTWGRTAKMGWYINMPESKERVGYDPLLFGRIVYFSSIIPSSDVCSFGGESWDYLLDALTGGALDFSVLVNAPLLTDSVSGKKGYASSVQSTVGISPTGRVIQRGRGQGIIYSTGSTGAISRRDVYFGNNMAGRVSWRELGFD